MADWGTRALERRLGDGLRARLPGWMAETIMFFAKQAWAALFGLLILAAIVISKAIWQPDWALTRYDALVIFAVVTQILMIWSKLESWEEARVILIFHVTGTVMEWFKVSHGSWSYPEAGYMMIYGVPLFSGFMYASVGSYVARATRIFDMKFAPYPPLWMTFAFGALCYINFFSHQLVFEIPYTNGMIFDLPDIRVPLFAASILLFGRTRVWFFAGKKARWLPLPLAALACAFVLWVAEYIGSTLTATWLYAGQQQFQTVNWAKMGSWYLLQFVAFTTVTLVSRSALIHHVITPNDRDDIIGRDAGVAPAPR
ncbi:DUF817 domain-containing protein [uncultured Litoreibacter sp.]|uniref:DUF817 domain-containing protein n=1 Tax=uncultured Litoreibacter sp. TaxID=1392394 RepID=UPI0026207C43|nr:DUF817 domain-containing protein [uncultured Litoreibacter sp.]